MISFIEGVLFHDKRTNLTLYEKHHNDFKAGNPDGIY
jgi:hypothetical protein